MTTETNQHEHETSSTRHPEWLLVVQRALLIISVLTLLVSVAFRCGLTTPGWLPSWTLPVLLAAAVGYLTNAIAIMMLFKPFDQVGGAEGVRIYVDKLTAELKDAMAMCGAHSLAEIDGSMIWRP